LSKQLGLPRPAQLRRYQPGQPLTEGPIVVGRAGKGALVDHLRTLLRVPPTEEPEGRVGALVLDATGVDTLDALAEVREFLSGRLGDLGPSGRVLVLARPAETATGIEAAAARQALDGLIRSVGKELRSGSTANLVRLAEDAEDSHADSTVRFLLSGRSAFVDGQVISIGPAGAAGGQNPDGPPHEGRTVLVTGSARGIGAAIAEVFARDGASVVCLDVPAQGDALARTANRIGGVALQLDITAPDAPRRLLDHLRERRLGLHTVVHNAGITRDKLLVNMDAARWESVMAVNLQAQLDLTQALLDADGVLRPGARVVAVSSQSGIAGNRGQTNYAASKAGVIGMVRAWAPEFAARGATINAVAPGFIVTEMTASMPVGTREVGARLNSLQQGGLPVDVAETIAWLAQPSAAGVNGQVVRVCGQSLLGA
jgi:3-oxoacyl-[acyl-carrier protein] reductase